MLNVVLKLAEETSPRTQSLAGADMGGICSCVTSLPFYICTGLGKIVSIYQLAEPAPEHIAFVRMLSGDKYLASLEGRFSR